MKKLVCLLLAIGMMGAAFAACEKEVAPENSSPVSSSSPTESSSPEETPITVLTKEEWEALENVELYENVTVITTQIDSYFKTVAETRVVDGYIYGKSAQYNVSTDEIEGSQPWYKMQIVSEDMMFAPILEDYEKIAYNDDKGVYYYTEEKVTDMQGKEWHYTTMEWRISGGKIAEIYFEFWYMDDVNGEQIKVTGSSHSEHLLYGTTVAPEGV
ncbi:MAG: hypothetical protein IJX49_05055 [Clostridia bacterium]|nr:hypothetical protein [Clostridia bacterium]